MAAPIKLKPATFDPVAKARDEFGWPADDPRIATLERIRTPAQRLALWLEVMDKLLVGAATAEDQAALGYLMFFMNQEHLLCAADFAPKPPDYSLVVEMAQAIKAHGEQVARDAAAFNIVKDVPYVQEIVNEFAADLLRKVNSGLIENGHTPLSDGTWQLDPEPRDLEQMDPRTTRDALERFQLKRQRGRPKKK